MSYKYSVVADHPIAFYQAVSGSVMPDLSGCGNSGTYHGSMTSTDFPMVYGEDYAIKIDNSNYINVSTINGYNMVTAPGGLATKYTSDNDFSLELWVYPNISSSSTIPLLADSTNSIGLFYDKGNITFKLNNNRLDFTIPYLKKSLYIVATYTGGTANIYIDGYLCASEYLLNFNFSNSDLSLSVGPTPDSNNYFLTNSIAVYRYALSSTQILNHYNQAQCIPAFQIASLENGELFEFYDNAISTKFSYSFPANKSWKNLISNGLYYNSSEKSIQVIKGSGNSQSIDLFDFVMIPSGPDMDDSRIEWEGDNGISVYTSLDGNTYVQCTNGEAIPQYTLNNSNFSNTRVLYIKINISTLDDSKYLPKLYSLSTSFYNNQIMYAKNSGSYFSKMENITGTDVNLSNNIYKILSRDYRNGLRAKSGSGFYINPVNLVSSLEFIYNPLSLGSSGLVSQGTTNYSWNSSGVISKNNIYAIYVNGVDKTSQTNISGVFKSDHLQHVVIVFSSAINQQMTMNYSSSGAVPALYQNIALYPIQLASADALEHFNLYIGKDATVVTDSSITLTESSVVPYNNDWIVIQNS